MKPTTLALSLAEIFNRIRNGEDAHKPLIEYTEPD